MSLHQIIKDSKTGSCVAGSFYCYFPPLLFWPAHTTQSFCMQTCCPFYLESCSHLLFWNDCLESTILWILHVWNLWLTCYCYENCEMDNSSWKLTRPVGRKIYTGSHPTILLKNACFFWVSIAAHFYTIYVVRALLLPLTKIFCFP